ncbi:hypothetical protein [Corynebacterium mastitidis]|uniref:hypothetical protein n=1 Tax=Corynebacterium mastitidis TaxID=161890 RepID=UPI0025506D9D|nr:hypothetical protein [Corynebacterium mastitidis]MDK8450902.1 hypothetical protein [Corynebacterium mastitidis]
MSRDSCVTRAEGVRMVTRLDRELECFVIRMEIDTECAVSKSIPAAVSMLRDAATAMEEQTDEYLDSWR